MGESRDKEPYSLRDRRRIRRSPRFYEDDVDPEQEVYSFRFSRHTKSLMSRDSTVGSLSDISEKDSVPASQPLTSSPQAGKILHVSQSNYTGDGVIGGFQSAELKATGDIGQGSRKGSQPLFKWVLVIYPHQKVEIGLKVSKPVRRQ